MLRLTLAALVAMFLASCATSPTSSHAASGAPRRMHVRTTAYCRHENGGVRVNAVGSGLSEQRVRSAAADWSRFPLGTHFRLVNTREEYVIDDYGWALVGTNTIDLYKSSRLEMRRWGVRQVDIDILDWGSDERSLKMLQPRAKHARVRRMVVALQNKMKLTEAEQRF